MKTQCCAAVLSIFMGICGLASAQPVQWAESAGGNGHFYEVVMDNPGDFESAQLNANARSHGGSSGHLVTLTSAEENAWVRDTLIAPHALTAGTFFMGGWNDVFWSGSGWRWVTEEAWNYTNWGQGEPSGGESVLSFKYGVDAATNAWNDVDYSYPWALGFIVEYDRLAKP